MKKIDIYVNVLIVFGSSSSEEIPSQVFEIIEDKDEGIKGELIQITT